MGMLNDKDAVNAFIDNTLDREWNINPGMSVDEDTAKAVVRELLTMRNIEVGYDS